MSEVPLTTHDNSFVLTVRWPLDDELEAEARWSLFSAFKLKPELLEATTELIYSSILRRLRDRYPRALPLPEDHSWHVARVKEAFYCLMANLCEGVRPADSVPRDSLVIAVAAMATVLYPVLPHSDIDLPARPRAAVEVPPDRGVVQ
jgi:hypothetical protein